MGIVRKKEEVRQQLRENVGGGEGPCIFHHLVEAPDEMNAKGRLFGKIVVPPGSSLGFHVHEGESETYYILSGTGEYENDDHTIHTVTAGDVTHTPPGHGHSIKNVSNEDLEFAALIIFD